jgi:hypothetical protein
MENSTQITIKSCLDAWDSRIAKMDQLINELTDAQIANEIAPGKNTGTYLLGHLAAVHDAMFPLLGFGEKLNPEMENLFIKNPDKSGIQKPPLKELINYWKKVNDKLAEDFKKLTPEEWLQKHTSVSEEDFKKEPHRNRLNVLISRTGHVAYHCGQMVLLKK